MSETELRQEYNSWNKRDTNRRVDILTELAFFYRNNQPKRDSAWNWALEAQGLARANNYLQGEVDALMRFGLLEEKTGNLKEAVDHYHKALVIRRDKLKKFSQAASVCNNLANVYKQQKDSTEKAIYYYKYGLELLHQEVDSTARKRSQAMIMNNLGDLYNDIGKREEARLYIDSTLTIRRALKDTVGIANALLNRGLLFKHIGNPVRSKADLTEAKGFFQAKKELRGWGKSLLALGDNAVIQHKIDTAIQLYQEALTFSENLEKTDVANIYLGKGIAHVNENDLQAAENSYVKALELFKEAKDDNGLALSYLNYGSFFKEQKKYREAVDFYNKSLSFLGDLSDVTIKYNVLEYLGESYRALGIPDSALKYTLATAQLRDELADSYRNLMNTEYNLTVAENKIQQLDLEKAEESQKKMQTYGIIGFGVSWLVLGIFILAYYFTRQRRRLAEQEVRLSIQQLALSQQELIEVMRDKELETNYARLSGIETTRKKLGQELHDNVGSMLSTVKMYFSSLDSRMDIIQEENRQQYQKANALLDQACDEVRRLSHEMVSAILMKFGLTAQLETLAETLQNTGKLQVELATFGLKERLDGQTEMNIYRMIQEMVQNVVKHAKATKISIQVNRFEEMINIMVEDNGVGFEVGKMEGGIGIANLRARVHELGGHLNIDSAPGKGTSISVDIPIEQEEPLTIKAN